MAAIWYRHKSSTLRILFDSQCRLQIFTCLVIAFVLFLGQRFSLHQTRTIFTFCFYATAIITKWVYINTQFCRKVNGRTQNKYLSLENFDTEGLYWSCVVLQDGYYYIFVSRFLQNETFLFSGYFRQCMHFQLIAQLKNVKRSRITQQLHLLW